MKSDVSQKYFDQHGTSLRDRMIRDSSKMAAQFGGWKAGVLNQVQKTGLFRYLLENLAGFDKRRVLPAYTKEPFYKWFEHRKPGNIPSSKKVVLFADTYLNYHEPNIGMAASDLLEDCGYHTRHKASGRRSSVTPRRSCCHCGVLRAGSSRRPFCARVHGRCYGRGKARQTDTLCSGT